MHIQYTCIQLPFSTSSDYNFNTTNIIDLLLLLPSFLSLFLSLSISLYLSGSLPLCIFDTFFCFILLLISHLSLPLDAVVIVSGYHELSLTQITKMTSINTENYVGASSFSRSLLPLSLSFHPTPMECGKLQCKLDYFAKIGTNTPAHIHLTKYTLSYVMCVLFL